MKEYISYSEMNLWYRDRAEYYRQYIQGIMKEPEPNQILGKIIHATIANPKYRWVKELKEQGYRGKRMVIIRKLMNGLMTKCPPDSEVGMRAITRDGIKLFAIFDGLDREGRVLYEYKSTDKQMAWMQPRVDRDEQLSFYAYVYHLVFHNYFREIRLIRANTKTGKTKTFYTSRGPKDIEYIADKIRKCVQEMKDNDIWEKRLSSKERSMLSQTKLF